MNTLDNTLKEIEILSSVKLKLEIDKKNMTQLLKELERKIENSNITFMEKILETITFGTLNYQDKHKENILGYKKKIQDIKSNNIDLDIETINTKILNFEKVVTNHLDSFKNKLLEFQTDLLYVSQNRYINTYESEDFKNKLTKITLNKEKLFLHKNIKNEISELLSFQENSQIWIEKSNTLFIKNEKINEKTFFDTIEANPLTDKQQEAVLVNENNNLVLAGAGSGKTSVIVAKVAYLIKKIY